MKLINTDSGYAILEDGIEYSLEWASKKDMDAMFALDSKMVGVPSYYSSDGRLYPIPDEEIDKSGLFNGKTKIFKAK